MDLSPVNEWFDQSVVDITNSVRLEVLQRPTHQTNIEFTKEGIVNLCARIGDKKATGLDFIPNKTLKIALKSRPEICGKLFDYEFHRFRKKNRRKSYWESQSYKPVELSRKNIILQSSRLC